MIPIAVNLTTNHQGYFEFRLCDKSDKASHLEQECYDRHLLEVISASNQKRWRQKNKKYWENVKDSKVTRYYVPHGENNFFEFHLQLPKKVRCKHCVLQWEYHTG